MNLARGQLSFFSGIIGLVLFAVIVAQENSADRKTAAGLQVTLLGAKPSEDFDADNRVPTFRMGSCPPGAAMAGIKIQANPGKDVIIVQLGLRFPADYPRADFPIPVLLDAAGKKYSSRNVMAPAKDLVPRIKTTGEQLTCEIPFELPAGTQITKLQFDDVVFDLKPGGPSTK